MIRPQTNGRREAVDLSGLWWIAFEDVDHPSRLECEGLVERHRIAIPGSWNEQFAELGRMNHVGAAWIFRWVDVPARWRGDAIGLRFASVEHGAEVWFDGRRVGGTDVPFLPFEVDLGDVAGARGLLAVRVDGLLPEQGPTQRVMAEDYVAEGRPKDEYLPAVRFDFFPYCGISRPVHLTRSPVVGLRAIRASSSIEDGTGRIALEVRAHADVATVRAGDREDPSLDVTLSRVGMDAASGGAIFAGAIEGLGASRLWSPEAPNLVDLWVEACDGDGVAIDEAGLTVGVKEVRVEGGRLLLNGAPITLKGFGKHEDSPIRGRGLDLPQLVKDFQLLKWSGANSVRTSHYPYSEEFLDLADEMGILVIGEVFSINLDFRKVRPEGLAAHMEAATRLIERDRHRACVIAWSLANEPGYLGEACYAKASAPYWDALFAHARALDPTRPLTHANVNYAGLDDPAFARADFLMINRYYGWYQFPGQLDRAVPRLVAEFDELARTHGKPIFVSEFGADALAGQHATTDQLFTEDYQSAFIAAYWRAIEAHPSVIGGHVWAFADFRTAQHARRVVFNLKGVFTRDRTPKRAAFTVRDLWKGPAR